jgi:enterochelin esterase-like enzyme
LFNGRQASFGRYCLFLTGMQVETLTSILRERQTLDSVFLDRPVLLDIYLPRNISRPEQLPLLLINDGQDLPAFGFEEMLDEMIAFGLVEPLVAVGIHCGPDRKNEYGTACISDYMGRGARAHQYQSFFFEELMPFIRTTYALPEVKEKAFAGFSLGALSALDLVWNHAHEFTKAGLFSGSFWWRTKSPESVAYSEDLDKIMHQQVRAGQYAPWLKFFFQCGTDDESSDRNGNGVIDSIDDTRDLIDELVTKGYQFPGDIYYYEMQGGKHDVPTWGRAMPEFLKWGWGLQTNGDQAR